MNFKVSVYCVAAITALMMTTSASAEALRSKVAFNTGIGEKTTDQPANGVKVTYQVKLQGGELDGSL